MDVTLCTTTTTIVCSDVGAWRTDISFKFKKDYEVIDVDGARILFDGGWGLVRASNTQPVLVLRFEAETESRLAEIRQLIESALAGVIKNQ